MKAFLITASIVLSAFLASCSSENSTFELNEEEVRQQELKEKDKAVALYGGGAKYDREDRLKAMSNGGYNWGEVTELNKNSAKALMLMAFERRVIDAKQAIDNTTNKDRVKKFEAIYNETVKSLTVHDCRINKLGDKAICSISVNEFNQATGRFEPKRNLQAFAKGEASKTWRPIAVPNLG